MSNKIMITQVIPTIQCEGPNLGTPSLLIRMGGCNLHCPFCDTKWSNDLNDSMTNLTIPDFNLYIDNPPFFVKTDEIYQFVQGWCKQKYLDHNNIYNIMITGGEPFYYPNELYNLIKEFNQIDKIKSIEIETNGTLFKNISQVFECCVMTSVDAEIRLNISPKLDLKAHSDIYNIEELFNMYKQSFRHLDNYIEHDWKSLLPPIITMKFIHCKKNESILLDFFQYIGINRNSICLMPLTPNITVKNESYDLLQVFRSRCQETINFCIKHGYIFSPREHVWVFGTKKNETLI